MYKTGIKSTFAAMYFKSSIRTNPSTGEPEGYYRLIESFRNVAGKVCHRTLLNVGFMGGVGAEELNRIQKLLTCKCHSAHVDLFNLEYDKESPVIRRWVNILYASLVTEMKIDISGVHGFPPPDDPSSGRDWQTIDLNSLRNRDVREIGGEWLCYQALEQLGISRFLSSQIGWFPDDVRLALTHIISRAVYPASELKTSRWIRENSSVCELTGFPMDRITKDSLYNISCRLNTLKDKLESYLSHCTNELFDIQDKILTN